MKRILLIIFLSVAAFFGGYAQNAKPVSDRQSVFCSAVHAYEIDETLTLVKEGKELSHSLQ